MNYVCMGGKVHFIIGAGSIQICRTGKNNDFLALKRYTIFFPGELFIAYVHKLCNYNIRYKLFRFNRFTHLIRETLDVWLLLYRNPNIHLTTGHAIIYKKVNKYTNTVVYQEIRRRLDIEDSRSPMKTVKFQHKYNIVLEKPAI